MHLQDPTLVWNIEKKDKIDESPPLTAILVGEETATSSNEAVNDGLIGVIDWIKSNLKESIMYPLRIVTNVNRI